MLITDGWYFESQWGPHGKKMSITDCCARELGVVVVMSSLDRVGAVGVAWLDII